MKKLKDIIPHDKIIQVRGNTTISINSITTDSRQVEKNSLFIALTGTNTDGHNYIKQAIEKGAVAVVHTKELDNYLQNITYIHVKSDNQEIAAAIANKFFDEPSKELVLIGVTGTNGKTTIATSLYNLFKNLGNKCGLISTIKIMIDDREIPTNLTTPDPITLHSLFRQMVDAQCKYCFMEVSSHASAQRRIAYCDFDLGIFTNLTHDHLDYHKTFKEYRDAKKLFFDKLKKQAVAITNADDKNGFFMVQNAPKYYTYSIAQKGNFNAKIIEKHLDGTLIEIDNKQVWIQFVGSFNVSNLLAVYSAAKILTNLDSDTLLNQISQLKPVEGRFDIVKHNNIYAIVDYAHTPDALEKNLNEIRQIKNPEQRIICIIGAGGNRDSSKRPIMAKICTELSDITIFTSDNPRNEDPQQIINDMLKGVSENAKYFVNSNRYEAIKMAVGIAKDSDIIFLAGKGHEKYQEINGIKHPFDDKQIVSELLKTK